MKNRRQMTPGSLLVLVIALAISIYYYAQGGADTTLTPAPPEAMPPQVAPITVTAAPDVKPAPITVTAVPVAKSASFDFYVLSLSWSPDYCATSGSDDPQQCSIGKKLGFVLHGLWPQYNKGYPSNCSNDRLPSSLKTKYAGLYPSTSLFDHEWEKHGTCTGLSPDDYLALSKKLKDSVSVPAPYRAPEQPVRVTTAQMKKEFVAANTGFSESSLAVYCSGSGRFLQELDVCFSTDGKPMSCSSEVQNDGAHSCGNADFLVRNVK